ncbi:MAG: YebC/PmpR family DNA-binding transcriptional regulator [Gammaproteobacteria bacterium WSBS_2016_MAG_OTU1]
MAGHSKWANIRHRKERMDSRRGKVFARLIKEASVAARMGGGDPDSNPRLRLAIEKARAANVPNDNLERAVKRGSGQLEGVEYAEVRYEGYGPGGAAVIVDCLTDNKNRSLSDVRHAFNKHGGNLGANGSVSYLFSRCGQFLYAPDADETAIMDIAVDNGAQDIQTAEDGSIEIICDAVDFTTLLDSLRAADLPPAEADIIMRPANEMVLEDKDADRMRKLLMALEDLDDTHQVHTSAALDDEE